MCKVLPLGPHQYVSTRRDSSNTCIRMIHAFSFLLNTNTLDSSLSKRFSLNYI